MNTSLCVLALLLLAVSPCCCKPSLKVQRIPHTWSSTATSIDAVYPHQHTVASYRAGSAVPFQGGVVTLGAYYVEIEVGTPPKPFQVLLDTGSSNLALGSPSCGTCGSSPVYNSAASSSATNITYDSYSCQVCNPDGSTNCVFGQPYPADINSTLCGYGISYGGGSSYLNGFLTVDMVNLGGYTVNNTIVSMTNNFPSGAFTSPPFSGIIGLAHELNACNPTWTPTIFGQIMAKYGNNTDFQHAFGLCLTPSSGGVLDLGFIDSTKFSGELQYVPITQDRWYNMGLLDILIGNYSIGLPPFVYGYFNDQIGAFIDSGTSTILFGPVIFSAFQSAYQNYFCSLPNVCGTSNIFNGVCLNTTSVASYPPLQFVFAGENGARVTLSVPPTAYFMPSAGTSSSCLGVASVIGINVILGDLFMENFYIVHDVANARVGFAPLAQCS